MVQSRIRGGGGVERARPSKHPLSPIQRAWAEKFKCIASWAKTPDPRAFNEATDKTKDSGWYYRDMISAALAGNLIREEGVLRVTTPTVRVTRTSAESVVNGVEKYLTPNLKEWDTNVFWNSSVNPSRLTFRAAGLYQVGGRIAWNAINGGIRYVNIRLAEDGQRVSFGVQAVGCLSA